MVRADYNGISHKKKREGGMEGVGREGLERGRGETEGGDVTD